MAEPEVKVGDAPSSNVTARHTWRSYARNALGTKRGALITALGQRIGIDPGSTHAACLHDAAIASSSFSIDVPLINNLMIPN
jgi:hypothetical protein